MGEALPKNISDDQKIDESVTKEQNESRKWLIQQLLFFLKIPVSEVFLHPTASKKTQQQLRNGDKNDSKHVFSIKNIFHYRVCNN